MFCYKIDIYTYQGDGVSAYDTLAYFCTTGLTGSGILPLSC